MFSIACSQEHFLIKIKSVKYSPIFSEFPTAVVYSLGSSHGAEIMYTNILLSPAKQTLICIHFSLCFTIHIHIPPFFIGWSLDCPASPKHCGVFFQMHFMKCKKHSFTVALENSRCETFFAAVSKSHILT